MPFRLGSLVLAAAFVAACGGASEEAGAPPGGSTPDDPVPPAPRTATLVSAGSTGVLAFAQTVAAEDGLGEVFPGQANSWVLDADFSLARGYGMQYATALALFLGAPTTPVSHGGLMDDVVGNRLAFFPGDQDAAEATFLSPLFTVADGVRTAAACDGAGTDIAPLAGLRSGCLNGTSGSRLSRTVSLASTKSYTLSWTDRAILRAGYLLGAAAAPYAPRYRVVVRDPSSGDELGELFAAADDFGLDAPSAHAVALPGGLAGPVSISFELRSAAEGFAVVDDVVLLEDGAEVSSFEDGDFETGSGGWTAGDAAESQNVRSGARAVALAGGAGPTLSVTRTFYAPPGTAWARLVDVFENASASAVSTWAVYLTHLGHAAARAAPTAGGKAVVGWDAEQVGRDVAIVHGSGAAHIDATSGYVFTVHALHVPAGGKVALAHHLVQLGRSEGGATSADLPPGVAAEAQAVLAGLAAKGEHVLDLEPGVLELVANF